MGQVPSILTTQSYIADYDLAFQISPIILQGGIAANAQGGILPLTNLKVVPSARFIPLPGSTLISQQIGMYPFANQFVAANATIQQPLTISLIMIAPVNQPGGYLTKLPTFIGLQNALANHNASGGTYAVCTPAYIYNNCVMLAMTDATQGEDAQKQIQWQFDFIQPIVTAQEAKTVLGNLMNKLTGGGQFTGVPKWSGLVSAPPANLTGVAAALSALGGSVPGLVSGE